MDDTYVINAFWAGLTRIRIILHISLTDYIFEHVYVSYLNFV